VPGVAATIVAGGFEDEVAVFVDQSKLAQLDLTVADLGQKLQATNVNLSGGTLEDGAQEYLVRTLNQFDTVDDIRSTIIFQRGGQIIRLGDVAEVKEGQRIAMPSCASMVYKPLRCRFIKKAMGIRLKLLPIFVQR